jgi:hypothetical protein
LEVTAHREAEAFDRAIHLRITRLRRKLEIDPAHPEAIRTVPGVAARLLQTYMLRDTNVKDICVDLAKAGRIDNTWGGGNRKPHDQCLIKRRSSYPLG